MAQIEETSLIPTRDYLNTRIQELETENKVLRKTIDMLKEWISELIMGN